MQFTTNSPSRPTRCPLLWDLTAFTSRTIRARPHSGGELCWSGGALPIRWACLETPALSPGAPLHTDQSDCPARENQRQLHSTAHTSNSFVSGQVWLQCYILCNFANKWTSKIQAQFSVSAIRTKTPEKLSQFGDNHKLLKLAKYQTFTMTILLHFFSLESLWKHSA